MGTDRHFVGPSDHTSDSTDGRDQLGDRVLGGHGVIQERGIESPASLCLQDAGGRHHLAHGIEDPVGTLGRAQPRAPVGEHRVVKALVVQGQATGDLPADPIPKGPGRLTVLRPSRACSTMTDATTSPGTDGRPRLDAEQVLEHLIGEQLPAVIGQESLHAALRNELATQGGGVESSRLGSLRPCTCQFLTITD